MGSFQEYKPGTSYEIQLLSNSIHPSVIEIVRLNGFTAKKLFLVKDNRDSER